MLSCAWLCFHKMCSLAFISFHMVPKAVFLLLKSVIIFFKHTSICQSQFLCVPSPSGPCYRMLLCVCLFLILFWPINPTQNGVETSDLVELLLLSCVTDTSFMQSRMDLVEIIDTNSAATLIDGKICCECAENRFYCCGYGIFPTQLQRTKLLVGFFTVCKSTWLFLPHGGPYLLVAILSHALFRFQNPNANNTMLKHLVKNWDLHSERARSNKF